MAIRDAATGRGTLSFISKLPWQNHQLTCTCTSPSRPVPHSKYEKNNNMCEPVDVSISQQIMESSSMFRGGNQSGHVVHHLSRRNPAVWHKTTHRLNFFFSLSFNFCLNTEQTTQTDWRTCASSWRLPSSRTSRRFLMVLVISPSLVYTSFMRGYTPLREVTSNSLWKWDTMEPRVYRVGLLST